MELKNKTFDRSQKNKNSPPEKGKLIDSVINNGKRIYAAPQKGITCRYQA